MTLLLPGTYSVPAESTLIVPGITPPPVGTEIGVFASSEVWSDVQGYASQLGVSKTYKRVTVYGDPKQNMLAWFQNNIPNTEKLALGFYGIGTAALVAAAQINAKAAVAGGYKDTEYRLNFEFDLPNANQGQGNQTKAVIMESQKEGYAAVKAIDPTAIVSYNVSCSTSPAVWQSFYQQGYQDRIGVDYYYESGNTLQSYIDFAKSVGLPIDVEEFGVLAGTDQPTWLQAQLPALAQCVGVCFFQPTLNPLKQPQMCAAIAKAFG